MKVLMISGDTHMRNPESEAGKRLEFQRRQVEQLDVFVWPQVHSWREIFSAARKNTYDVVTAQDPFWRGLLAWKIARFTGAKLNLQVHTDLWAQPLLRRILAAILLHHADSVRVVSQKIRAEVEAMSRRTAVRVLPIYLDIGRFQALVPQAHAEKTILWIGRFEAEKAPLEALNTLKSVLAQGMAARLVMLGKGSLEAKLRHAAKGLPVEFPGWRDPAEYLPTADVVLCTSQHESWGASMVESLAAGVPVVAPDVGIAKEAGAIVVSRKDLATKVGEVLQHPVRATLQLSLPSAPEWAQQWRETLV